MDFDAAFGQEDALMLAVVVGHQQVVVEQAGNGVAVRVLEVIGFQVAFEWNLPVGGVGKLALVERRPAVVAPVAQVGAKAAEPGLVAAAVCRDAGRR